MKRAFKIIGIVTLGFVLLAGIWVTDNLVYPFRSETPNYSDVESAFNTLQFPSEWQEIDSSENRGLHGRGCNPLNDAGCFHKSKTFKVPDETSIESLKSFIVTSNYCEGVSVSELDYAEQAKKTYNYECGIGDGLEISGTLRGPKNELSFFISSIK